MFFSIFLCKLKRNLKRCKTFNAFLLASASSFREMISLNNVLATVLQSNKKEQSISTYLSTCEMIKDKNKAIYMLITTAKTFNYNSFNNRKEKPKANPMAEYQE